MAIPDNRPENNNKKENPTMTTKKINYEKIQLRIKELEKKKKEKTITPEEKIELKEQREIIRRNKVDEQFKALKLTLENGKRDACWKILKANGITSEKKLMEMIDSVNNKSNEQKKEVNEKEESSDDSEIKNEKLETNHEERKDNYDDNNSDDTTENSADLEKIKNENQGIIKKEVNENENTNKEAPVCECGCYAEKRFSKKKNQYYWICPNYPQKDRKHYFSWIN